MNLEEQTIDYINRHIYSYYKKPIEAGAKVSEITSVGIHLYNVSLGNALLTFLGTADGTANLVSVEGDIFSNSEVAFDSSVDSKSKIDIVSIDFKSRIDNRLKYLYEMLNKYAELDNRTNNKYSWRSCSITDQIDSLEFILNDLPNDDWNECYLEDLRDM